MSVLPFRHALSPPPGGPHDVRDLATDVSAAAVRLGDLAAHLSGRAHVAGWRGADADAAAERVTVMTALAHVSAEALRGAGSRLAMHSDVLDVAHRRIVSLRAAQEDDFGAMQTRLSAPVGDIGDDGLGTVPYLEDLEAAEELRRREHAALLSMVADSAAATGRALAAATEVIGGTGRAGAGPAAVLAHLSTVLPEWAAPVLLERGSAYARQLIGGTHRPEDYEAEAELVAALASSPAFATGFFRQLGADGLRRVLDLLGGGSLPASGALVGVVVDALEATGGWSDTRRASAGLGEVLSAGSLAGSPDQDPGGALVGMATVLAAGLRRSVERGSPGLPPDVLVDWGRHFLRHEQTTGMVVGGALRPEDADPLTADPLHTVVASLVASPAPDAAAQLLDGPRGWAVLWSRAWNDGGAALGALIEQLVLADADGAENAVLAGLAALGDGLEDENPDGWTVDPRLVPVLAPSLGRAAAAQVSVPLQLLDAGLRGQPPDAVAAALHGLAHLTVAPAAAVAIEEALTSQVQISLGRVGALEAADSAPAVAIPGAWFAVREYGQRLAHTLAEFERQAEAVRKQRAWNATVGLAVEFLPKGWSVVAAVPETLAARWLGMDGRWEAAPDEGLRFTAEAVAAHVVTGLAGADVPTAEVMGRTVADAFRHMLTVLGEPVPPLSADDTVWEAVQDSMLDSISGLGIEVGRRLPTVTRAAGE